MPNHTLARNLKTQRREAGELLGALFTHLEGHGITLTGLSIATNGAITLTIAETLTAEVRAHLGLS